MTESRLKEYIDINPKVKLQKGEKYSSVEMEKITVGQKVADANNKAEYTGKSCSKFLPNDTLMARITPCLENGKIAKYESDTAGFGSTEFFVLRAKENKVTADYVYYLSQTHYIRQLAVNSMTGASGRQRADAKYIGNIKWNFPDIEIQIKIADILSAYDNLIENNNKRIHLLEQMAENFYKEWFVRFRFPGYEDVDFENGIPKEWKIVRLSDIADIIMGQSPESENYNTNCKGLPFHQGVGSYGDFYLIDDVYSTKGNRIAEANSIIFSVRAPVGRINITLNKIILGRGVAGINSILGYNAYLLWMLKNQFQQEDIIGNGSIFASVTKKELFGFKILMPNENLMQKFDSIASGIESEMRKISLINSNLKKQRDMLLPRLMSGKLEV
ncbi:restriction endonuclease subunit S [Holdemanella porci]|uniref:restriction endonuclease subunit S n=1 Tax=Holdemanella porci TaxID=2652276 RepID=UPI0022E4BFD3|nr:restriction endonuclease subunit S [Holdemanella porci]